MMTGSELLYPQESFEILGAGFDVYNEKGCGFLEPVYHDCLEIELHLRQIPFAHEPALPLTYKGRALRHTYSPDFTCYEKIVLELKACRALADEHVAQLLNYLHATGYHLGILLNFGHYPRLEYKRVVRSAAPIRGHPRHPREHP